MIISPMRGEYIDVSVYLLEKDTKNWVIDLWIYSQITLEFFVSCWAMTLQFTKDKATKNETQRIK